MTYEPSTHLCVCVCVCVLQPAYVVHIFPPCAFSSGNLSGAAPDLLHSVSEMAYLLIIIATVSS